MKTTPFFQKVPTLVLAACMSFVFATNAVAAEKPANYPRRPVTVIVPFGAGGGADQMARAFLPKVSEYIGVPITIVNKPGGNATVGFAQFWSAPADGYTLLQYNDDAVTHYVSGILKQDPTKDYVPLTISMIVYSQIYIRPGETRFTDWNSFVKYAKEHPGEVTLGNIAQRGNLEEMQASQLEQAAGIKLRHISFDQPAERYAALVGSHVDALLEQPGDVAPYLESKDMKPVISFTDVRPAEFKDIPCIKELNPKMTNLYKVRGFYIHGNLPKPIAAYLLDAFEAGFKSEQFQQYVKVRYPADTKTRNAEECKEFIRGMMETYARLYEEMGYAKR
ncbi:MAG: tripartite tricarboxylate transporter substrate binding protein [Desulfovibrio sp.]|nr:tripartite tricarboxylate transporter substrate binding protein [Desulfovibrio sp.]